MIILLRPIAEKKSTENLMAVLAVQQTYTLKMGINHLTN